MSQFRTRKSFGPRISLTENQEAAIKAQAREAGLWASVENCWTGSAYVTVSKNETHESINGNLYDDAGDEIAKIRLSGHDEGGRQDSTHVCVGSKSECLKSLKLWLAEIITASRAVAV